MIALIWKFRGLIGLLLVVLAALGVWWWISSVVAENERLNDRVKEQTLVIESQTKQIAKDRLAFKLADDINRQLESKIKELEEADKDVIDSLTSDDIDDPIADSVREYLEKIK